MGQSSARAVLSGRWESIQFTSRLQPTQIALGTTQNATDLLKLEYGYGTTDNNGNVQLQKITVPGVTFPFIQAYTYDELNRLKAAEETQNSVQTWKQTFTYDRYGNKNYDAVNTTTHGGCSAAVCNPTVSTSNNRFNAGQGYTYDTAGNTTVDAQGRQFTYDAENKQTLVKDATNATVGTYLYDGDGKRVKKISATENIVFVYDAAGKLIEEYSGPTLQTSYIYAGSMLLSTEASTGTGYLTHDQLGSPRINTTQSGSVTARHDYHPFGEEIIRTGYASDTLRKRFTGYMSDKEIGLEFAGERMYSSQLGRFYSVDSFSADSYAPASHNRYQYGLGNPLRFVDPDGRYERDVHVELTVVFALAVGFSERQANVIANANQWLDEPNSPWNPEQVGEQGKRARELYHFTDQATRWAHWTNFSDLVSAGSNDAFAALGTFMHPQQDSFSHRGFGADYGQLPGALDNLNLFSSPKSMEEEARKYDRTSFRPELAEEMARDTFSKLLRARNMMLATGKFGSFRRPVPYSAIEKKVADWVRADAKQKPVILNQIRMIILNYGDSEPTPVKKKKTKTTIIVHEKE